MTTNNQLGSLIDRIERLVEEKALIEEGIKEIYIEAKLNGFDTKTMKKVVAIRKQGIKKHQEERQMIDLYIKDLGMLADTPLGKAAIAAQTGEAVKF
jgi:uncharacterized protein (UPF0335 family)